MEQILTIKEEIGYIVNCFERWFEYSEVKDDFTKETVSTSVKYPWFKFAKFENNGEVVVPKMGGLNELLDDGYDFDADGKIRANVFLHPKMNNENIESVLLQVGLTGFQKYVWKSGETMDSVKLGHDVLGIRVDILDSEGAQIVPSELVFSNVNLSELSDREYERLDISDLYEVEIKDYSFLEKTMETGKRIRLLFMYSHNGENNCDFELYGTVCPQIALGYLPISHKTFATILSFYKKCKAAINDNPNYDNLFSDEEVDDLYLQCVDLDKKRDELIKLEEIEAAHSKETESNQVQQESPTDIASNKNQNEQMGCGSLVVIGIVIASLGVILF